MPIEVVKRYTREEIRAHPEKLYIFGDNRAREGMGGQAFSARGEPNAVGICTKNDPGYDDETSFMSDEQYISNIQQIFKDFEPVFTQLYKGGVVVWPEDGIGTGLAQLPDRAPLTLSFIEEIVYCLWAAYGLVEDA